MSGTCSSEKWLDQQPDHEPTMEELVAEKIAVEQIVAEQMRCLPSWWEEDVPPDEREEVRFAGMVVCKGMNRGRRAGRSGPVGN